ncbi:MAG: glycosyltransferase [Emcibacteraceae bacterium]|nr:glycosyltransferase [Emcibacteraceae bacterium]
MAVWRGDNPGYLKECFISLKEQSVQATEIIVVCDGVISEKLDEVLSEATIYLPIKRIQLPVNAGLAKALNLGLSQCNYELVARMDPDDICYPNRFEKQKLFMDANPEVVASSSAVDEFSDQSTIVCKRLVPASHAEILDFAKLRSPLNHPAVIFRRSVIISVGGYPNFRKAQDLALWSLLLSKGYILKNIQEPLVKMRAGDAIFDRRSFDHFKNELEVIKFQYNINFINKHQYLKSITLRAIARFAPLQVRKFIYKLSRSRMD